MTLAINGYKECPGCKQSLEATEEFWYTNRFRKDGWQCFCKDCTNKRNKKYRETHKEQIAKRQKEYKKEYWKTRRELQRANAREYINSNPEKRQAHQAVNNALALDKLEKPDRCSVNNSNCHGRIEAHHEDYSKPFDIIWLCATHHKKLHIIKNNPEELDLFYSSHVPTL